MALQLLHEASLGPLLWRPQEVAALRYPHLEQQVLLGSCSFLCLCS